MTTPKEPSDMILHNLVSAVAQAENTLSYRAKRGRSNREAFNRERRLRDAARRQGLRLEKCRLRDVDARAYGTFRLVDARTGNVVRQDWDLPRGYGLDLDDVQGILHPRPGSFDLGDGDDFDTLLRSLQGFDPA